MNFCPSDQQLEGLLADKLTTADRDAHARHVEKCATCQERLARLTTADTENWQHEQPRQGSRAEERAMQSLKLHGRGGCGSHFPCKRPGRPGIRKPRQTLGRAPRMGNGRRCRGMKSWESSDEAGWASSIRGGNSAWDVSWR